MRQGAWLRHCVGLLMKCAAVPGEDPSDLRLKVVLERKIHQDPQFMRVECKVPLLNC